MAARGTGPGCGRAGSPSRSLWRPKCPPGHSLSLAARRGAWAGPETPAGDGTPDGRLTTAATKFCLAAVEVEPPPENRKVTGSTPVGATS